MLCLAESHVVSHVEWGGVKAGELALQAEIL